MKSLKFYILLLLLILIKSVWAQNPQLAKKYLDDGDFEKAIYEYKLLVKKAPYNQTYYFNLIKAYQSVGKHKEAEVLIKQKNLKRNPQNWVYLGYNYQLQKDTIKAQKYYDKAIKSTTKKNYLAYSVGSAFQQLYLLKQAVQVYENAMKNNEQSNFYMQLAKLYGELNNQEKMIENFLNLAEKNRAYQTSIRYYLSQYITQDPENKINIILKKQLIQRIKNTSETKWYRLLHWLYIQQKEYKKAFFQLKSLYKKNEAEISEIYQLANTANFSKKKEEARSIYNFVIEHSLEKHYVELSKLAVLKMEINNILSNEKKDEIQQLFQEYSKENWNKNNKIALEILFADFLAFHLKKSEEALKVLSNLLNLNLRKRQEAEVLLKKADILTYHKNFNQALIIYTQVQLDFPNSETGRKATYKIAKTSFYQGDIDWAHSQLKAIKSVASDLIANDAIDLDLVIINNKEEGDTIHSGLKELAKAKFEIFRKNPKIATQLLDTILIKYKSQQVYDDALWLQAQIFEQTHQYKKALINYEKILDNKTEELLKDDAIYQMATIYHTIFYDDEKAQKLYKKIVIEYPASFWFVDARKYYRELRGDNDLP